MSSVGKLLRRFVGILLLSSFLLLLANLILFVVVFSSQLPEVSPWKTAQNAADQIKMTDGVYTLPTEAERTLTGDGAWAVYIENKSGSALWYSRNLPDTIPLSYTASDIAELTRGYLQGYSTFTGTGQEGLMIVGYPEDTFWKHTSASWDYQFIKNLPKTITAVLAVNILLIFALYFAVNSRLLHSVKPLTDAIAALSKGENHMLLEKGVLSELSASINQTADVLKTQRMQLQKKEEARTSWITGISHDIRTPLSMVMGYAGQLQDDRELSDVQRKKAAVIVTESERIRDLVGNLNLASKLENNMQAAKKERQNAVSLLRQAVTDHINSDAGGDYPVLWETAEELQSCPIFADRELLLRVIHNLLTNAVRHNPKGCHIFAAVSDDGVNCTITVEDDGKGADDETLEKLNRQVSTSLCKDGLENKRHGLGLLIVRQITELHGGSVLFSHSKHGGFSTSIVLPLCK